MKAIYNNRDDRGVTSVEYSILIILLGIILIPFIIAAYNALWSGSGGVTTISASVGRGPYDYPNGPVQVSKFGIQSLGPVAYTFPTLTAINGNLFVNIAPKDKVTGVAGTVVTAPYNENAPSQISVPQTGGTVWVSVVPKGSSAVLTSLPAGFDMSKFPVATSAWSCGC